MAKSSNSKKSSSKKVVSKEKSDSDFGPQDSKIAATSGKNGAGLRKLF